LSNGAPTYVFPQCKLSDKIMPRFAQDLTLTIVSERLARELTLVEDIGELSTVNVQSFVNEQEWRLYNNVETQEHTVTRIYQDDESTHPSFTATCHASRKFGFYFWNIIFVMVANLFNHPFT